MDLDEDRGATFKTIVEDSLAVSTPPAAAAHAPLPPLPIPLSTPLHLDLPQSTTSCTVRQITSTGYTTTYKLVP